MTDSLYQRVGGAHLPLDVSVITGAATFEPADPSLETISALCAAAIRAELGTGTASAWYAVASTLPTTHRLNCSDDPVGTIWKLGSDGPSATMMRQVKVGAWPLLAVWRDGAAEYEQKTYMLEVIRQKWQIMWALADYEADLALKLSPVLSYVGRVIAQTLHGGRHPAYQSGAKQFGPDVGWISRIHVASYQAGAAKFSDDEESRFWACSATVETEERIVDLDEGDDSGGLSLGVTAAVGDAVELLPGFVVGDGDHPG